MPVSEGHEPLLATIGVDITEHLNLREQFRHFQRLDLIGLSVAGLAHDSNNLLAIIQASAEFALHQIENPQAVGSQISSMLTAIDRFSHLIDRMLDLSRPHSEERLPMDLNARLRADLPIVAAGCG